MKNNNILMNSIIKAYKLYTHSHLQKGTSSIWSIIQLFVCRTTFSVVKEIYIYSTIITQLSQPGHCMTRAQQCQSLVSYKTFTFQSIHTPTQYTHICVCILCNIGFYTTWTLHIPNWESHALCGLQLTFQFYWQCFLLASM